MDTIRYGLTKLEWNRIKDNVIDSEMSSTQVKSKYELNSKQIWFLYDKLLQEKYNHLYKREKLVDPKVDDFVYCDYDGFGRGVIKSFSLDESIMVIKFDKRELTTFCDSNLMVTIFDGAKLKITRL